MFEWKGRNTVMAMSRLKVTPQQLKREANDIRRNAKAVQSTTKEMITTINSINDSVWSGDAAEEYTNRFKKLDDDMDDIYNMIIEASKDLDAVADKYTAVEKANDTLAASLKIDL